MHVPGVTSHASHAPAQARLQQNPSTQALLAHSLAAAHAEPFCFSQVPFVVRLHALPAPHDETVQQTPSVQKPVEHASPDVHVEPRERSGAHLLPLQKKPATQSVLLTQAPRQVVAPHE